MKRLFLISFTFTAVAWSDIVSLPELDCQTSTCGLSRSDLETPDTIVFDLPQFDPSLGTLLSVAYALTNTEDVRWGYNDESMPIGTPFEITVSGETVSSLLPIDVSSSATFDFKSCACARIGFFPPFLSSFPITASGTTLSSAFIGTGTVPVDFTSTADISSTDLFGALDSFVVSDVATLDVTYTYAPVPEPRLSWPLLIGVAGIFAIAKWRMRYPGMPTGMPTTCTDGVGLSGTRSS